MVQWMEQLSPYPEWLLIEAIREEQRKECVEALFSMRLKDTGFEEEYLPADVSLQDVADKLLNAGKE